MSKTINLQGIEKETHEIYIKAKRIVEATTGRNVFKVLPFVFEEALANFISDCKKNGAEITILKYLNGTHLKHREDLKGKK